MTLVSAVLTSPVLRRVLEGKHQWGYLDEAPLGRGVWVRQRLTVYPPGTNSAERRLLTMRRDWPLVGAITTIFLMVGVGALTRPFVGAGFALLIYLGVYAVLSHRTAVPRRRSLTVVVVSLAVNGSLEVHGNAALLGWSKGILDRLEATRRSGTITPLQYEAIWTSVYRTIEANPPQLERADTAI